MEIIKNGGPTPCPFCSEDSKIKVVTTGVTFKIRCGKCGAQTKVFDNKEDAIAAWERRPSNDDKR